MATDSGRNVLADAVRQLREHLGDSQMEFANRMGWHIVTLARYETKRAPKGKALAALERLADEQGRGDLREAFRAALAEELGTPYPPVKGGIRWDSLPEGYEVAVTVLIGMLANPQDPDTRKVMKILKPRMDAVEELRNRAMSNAQRAFDRANPEKSAEAGGGDDEG